MQQLLSMKTAWHITLGAYGGRLHGGDRWTVDRQHNQRGEPFVGRDTTRTEDCERKMIGLAVRFTIDQRAFIESIMRQVCERGRWLHRICAAPPDVDHVHVLLDADPAAHGKQIRQWLKRWLTQRLDSQWARPQSGTWWAEGGSTKPVKDGAYLNNVFEYIKRQRTTLFDE